ncbi:MAG: hypothetical protein LBD37_10245 [Treponema sp.]|nr:hypothetical protein [Treponema sp.]
MSLKRLSGGGLLALLLGVALLHTAPVPAQEAASPGTRRQPRQPIRRAARPAAEPDAAPASPAAGGPAESGPAAEEAPPVDSGGETAGGQTAAEAAQPAAPAPAAPPLDLDLILVPLNASSLWGMPGVQSTDTLDFNRLAIAKNLTGPVGQDKAGDPLIRPLPNGVYFGVPARSGMSLITLGVLGNNVDRFISTTSFQETSYRANFGYFGFDKSALSAGVSGRFKNGIVTSLYYNGNIIEDIFGYIANNALTNGRVGVAAYDDIDGSAYDYLGDLKDRSSINSRTNIALMFAGGPLGFTIGYSQKLFGLVKQSTGNPQREGDSLDAHIYDTQDAVLDDALVPHAEVGFRFMSQSGVIIKTALSFQVDIHQHRELSEGQILTLENYYPPIPGSTPPSTTTGWATNGRVINKLAADYIEPAAVLRFELDLPSQSYSRLSFGIEAGGRVKLYANNDDKGDGQTGIFWSQRNGAGGAGAYYYSLTTKDAALEVIARPSIRYLGRFGERVRIGLNGGFGIGARSGQSVTKTYTNASYAEYLKDGSPYDDSRLITSPAAPFDPIVTTIPDLDLSLYPNLGIGFSVDVVRNIFSVNGGVGATQTLYTIQTGSVETTGVDGAVLASPLHEQSWGKPLAQFALGAIFTFKEHFTLDAMFSTNGTDLDGSNFVVQLSYQF